MHCPCYCSVVCQYHILVMVGSFRVRFIAQKIDDDNLWLGFAHLDTILSYGSELISLEILE